MRGAHGFCARGRGAGREEHQWGVAGEINCSTHLFTIRQDGSGKEVRCIQVFLKQRRAAGSSSGTWTVRSVSTVSTISTTSCLSSGAYISHRCGQESIKQPL